MADTNKKHKNFLNILIVVLVIVCMILLMAEIISNTRTELKAKQSDEGYAVNLSWEIELVQPTLTPTVDPYAPTLEPIDAYYDTGE